MKRYFDVMIIVPLEEEFEVVVENFEATEDLSTAKHIRFAVSLRDQTTRILLTKQSVMGRSGCQEAVNECLADLDCGLLVCLGIAGALSNDVAIGDVCYSRAICDVVDNAKIAAAPSRKQKISLSPTWYESPPELIIPITLDRISPFTKGAHADWSNELETLGKALIPNAFTGRNGKETIGRPKVREGTIACGNVSASPDYNEAVRATDRKVLAIETESGGLFFAARQHNVPAITVRGISDYAGIDKNVFERETGNNARKLAISTATSFLVRQLRSGGVVRYLDKLANDAAQLPLQQVGPPEDSAASVLIKLGEEINAKLRDLAPGFSLVAKLRGIVFLFPEYEL